MTTATSQRARFFVVLLALLALVSVGFLGEHPKPAHGAVSVTTCPAPSGAPTSTAYTVGVAGQNAPVYASASGPYSYFQFSGGPVAVTVTTAATAINTVDIRPSSLGIFPTFTPGSTTLSFTLPSPTNVVVSVNGNMTTPLQVFGDPKDTPPSPTDPNVIYYGPGLYNVNTVFPAAGKTVYVSCGAFLKGKIQVGSTTDGGAGANNVTIRGPGVVDSTFLADPGRPLRITNSSTVNVKDTIFIGKTAWGVVSKRSSGITYDNIHVINSYDAAVGGNPDGVDFVSTSNSTLKNSYIHSYDDAVAFKNREGSAWFGSDDSNTVDHNFIVQGIAGNGYEIGWEIKAGYSVTNITFSNSDIYKTANPKYTNFRAALSIHTNEGGTVSGITYSNIRIEHSEEHYVDFRVLSGGGNISHISVAGVSVTGGPTGLPSEVVGLNATNNVNSVAFTDFTLFGTPITSASQGNVTVGPYATNVTFTATPVTQTTTPVADVYVRANNTQCGTCKNLLMKNSQDNNYDRKMFVRFDMSSTGLSNVTSAKLRLFLSASDGALTSATVYPVTSDTWTEAMTWATAPSNGSPITSQALGSPGAWYEWDITATVNATLAGDKVQSLMLFDPNVQDKLQTFSSREGSNPPQLVLTP